LAEVEVELPPAGLELADPDLPRWQVVEKVATWQLARLRIKF